MNCVVFKQKTAAVAVRKVGFFKFCCQGYNVRHLLFKLFTILFPLQGLRDAK